jgi:hypothetical protein
MCFNFSTYLLAVKFIFLLLRSSACRTADQGGSAFFVHGKQLNT